MRDRDATARKGLRGFLDERLGLDSVRSLAGHKVVPVHRTTTFYLFGGMALFLFIIQLVTGVLLSLYYTPTPEGAFESVQRIMTDVPFGWLVRSIHSWCANLLIGVLLLHLLTTFIMRAYRRPRELTWATGVLLLFVFFAFGFSGYLLPWNELAFFATNVGTKIAGVIPFIGEDLLLFTRAGENVTGDTLARFHALHVAILPLVAFALLGLHLWLVQKHGMSVPEHVLRESGPHKPRVMPFFPHFLLRDMLGWYVALAVLAALAALFPWELGNKANPFGAAPPNIKPEWYFLFMFQALKKLPPHLGPFEGEAVGVVFFSVAALGIVLVPFIDRAPAAGRMRRVLNASAAIAVIFFIVMTAWGILDET